MVKPVSKGIEVEVMRASKIMVNILAESLIQARVKGISVPQYRILDMVGQGVDKPADIARMLDVSPPAITWFIERLEENGFLKRTASTEDRRRVVLSLTRKGTSTIDRVNTHRQKHLDEVLGRMNAGSARQLEASLHSFSESYLELKEGE